MSKIFKVIQYILIAVAIGINGYHILPIEFKEMIPQVNELVVSLTSIFSGVTGVGIASISSMLSKTKNETDTKVANVEFGLTKVVGVINNLVEKITTQENKQEEVVRIINNESLEIKELIKLVKTDLKVKKSNPLIDKEAKKIIDEALNKGGVENEEPNII